MISQFCNGSCGQQHALSEGHSVGGQNAPQPAVGVAAGSVQSRITVREQLHASVMPSPFHGTPLTIHFVLLGSRILSSRRDITIKSSAHVVRGEIFLEEENHLNDLALLRFKLSHLLTTSKI